MPISTLYASPENSSSVWFCAFHPNLAIVPSLPLLFICPVIALPDTKRLGWPPMPSCFLLVELAARLAMITLSGICSIRRAEDGCRNAEDQVVVGGLGVEVGL